MRLEEIEAIDDVERLIILRKRLNMNQKEFSEHIGYTHIYLAYIENYKKPFTRKLNKKINQFLNTIPKEYTNFVNMERKNNVDQ